MSHDHLRKLAQAATPGLQPANLRKLRYAAECATQGTWRNGTDPCHFDAPEVTDDKSFAYYVPDAKNAAFIAAASPSVVLSMLDALDAAVRECEVLHAEVKRLRDHVDAAEQETAWRIDNETRAAKERDELRAELGHLRKHVQHNDEDYKTMKAVLRSVHSVYQEALVWRDMTAFANSTADDRLMRAIDTATTGSNRE